MAAPACLAGGKVMLPWAETAAAKREALTMDAFILTVLEFVMSEISERATGDYRESECPALNDIV
jgi:hypothetical protein